MQKPLTKTPTKEQLENFCRMRNASEHQSNLQFQIDAECCGIKPSIFEGPEVLNNHNGYLWRFASGVVVERAARRERFKLFAPTAIIDADTGEPGPTIATVAARFK